MRRAEVWTVSGGPGYAGKPRPAVIVQDDLYASTASVAICGFTTTATPADITRPLIEPAPTNGLKQQSWVMVDKISAVPRTRLGRAIGHLSPAEMGDVDQGLLIFLGLAH